MLKKKEQKKWKKVFYSRLTLIALVFLLVFLGRATWGMYVKEKQTSEAVEQSRKELLELKERYSDWEKKLNKVSTERGVEEIIRENFDMAKEGEGVIVMIDDESKKEDNKKEEKSWWQKIIGIFK